MTHVIASQIKPRFGSTPTRSLRPSMVQAWVGEMSASGLAPSTVESYFRVLAAVMIAARQDRLIYESPTDGVTVPRAEHNGAALVPLSVEQVQAIADKVPAHYRRWCSPRPVSGCDRVRRAGSRWTGSTF